MLPKLFPAEDWYFSNRLETKGVLVTRTAQQIGFDARVELHPLAVALEVLSKGSKVPIEQRQLLCSRHTSSIRTLVEGACRQTGINASDWVVNSVSVSYLEPLSPPAVSSEWDWQSAQPSSPGAFQIVRDVLANMHPDEAGWPRIIALRVHVTPASNSSTAGQLWPEGRSAPPAAPAQVGGSKRPLQESPGALPILPTLVSSGSKRARGLHAAALTQAAASGAGGITSLSQNASNSAPRSAGSSSTDDSQDSVNSPLHTLIPFPRTVPGHGSDSDADSGIDSGGVAAPGQGGGGIGSLRLAAQLLDDGSLLPRSNGWGSNEKLPAGCTGLSNLGNTCFMNAALQCLSNTPLLTAYLLRGGYELDVNKDNPLGHNGRIILSFAKLVRSLWAGGLQHPSRDSIALGWLLQQKHDSHALLQSVLSRKGANGDRSLPEVPPVSQHMSLSTLQSAGGGAVAPSALKFAVASVAPQFGGYQQHDSQELLSFLLDGLHEDVNKITSKPYVEVPSGKEGKDDNAKLAASVWAAYAKRNDSIITELFQGQYRSRVQCVTPGCPHVSLTFDPFSFLSLPLPVQQRHVRFDCTVLDVGAGVKIAQRTSVQEGFHEHMIPAAHSVLLPERSTVSKAMVELAKQLDVECARLVPAQTTGIGATLLPLRAPAPCVGVRDAFDGDQALASLTSLATAAASRIVVFKLPTWMLEAADEDAAYSSVRRERVALSCPSGAVGQAAGASDAVLTASSVARGFAARRAAAFDSLNTTLGSGSGGTPFVGAAASVPRGQIRRLSLEPRAAATAPAPAPVTATSDSDGDSADDDTENALGSVDSAAAVEQSQSPPAQEGGGSQGEGASSPDSPPAGTAAAGQAIDSAHAAKGTQADAAQAGRPPLWRVVVLNVSHRRLIRTASPGKVQAGPHGIGYPALLPVVVASEAMEDAAFKDMLPTSVQHLPRLTSASQLSQVAQRWVAPLPALGGDGGEDVAPVFALQTSDSGTALLRLLDSPEDSCSHDSLWQMLGCSAPEAAAGAPAAAAVPRRGVFGSGLNGSSSIALPSAASVLDDESSDSDDLFSSRTQRVTRSASHSQGRWLGLRNFQTSPTLCIVWPVKTSVAVQRYLRPLLPPGDPPSDLDGASSSRPKWPMRVPRALSSELSTPIPAMSGDGVTLTDCMQLWESEEQLGQSDTWYCSECKQHVRALKRLSLWSAPEYLMVHLKRFKFSAFSRARINTRVHFPVTGWDLSAHVLEADAAVHAHGCVYDLYAVINHMGGMGGGHYTACAKHPLEDMWFDFDDSHVSRLGPSTAERVQNRLTSSQAYVLFYARRSGAATKAP